LLWCLLHHLWWSCAKVSHHWLLLLLLLAIEGIEWILSKRPLLLISIHSHHVEHLIHLSHLLHLLLLLNTSQRLKRHRLETTCCSRILLLRFTLIAHNLCKWIAVGNVLLRLELICLSLPRSLLIRWSILLVSVEAIQKIYLII